MLVPPPTTIRPHRRRDRCQSPSSFMLLVWHRSLDSHAASVRHVGIVIPIAADRGTKRRRLPGSRLLGPYYGRPGISGTKSSTRGFVSTIGTFREETFR